MQRFSLILSPQTYRAACWACATRETGAALSSFSVQTSNLPVANSLPNALSSEAYSYLDLAWSQSLVATDVSTLQPVLPQLDDDEFMAELVNTGGFAPLTNIP